MTTVKSLIEKVQYFHELVSDTGFLKTFKIEKGSERRLSVPLRFYLAGIYFHTYPEHGARRRIGDGNIGRPKQLDFLVGNLGLEVATRSSSEPLSKLKAKANRDEIDKLCRHNGKALLLLLDFEKRNEPPDMSFLEEYTSIDGRSFAKATAYHVAYVYRLGHQSRAQQIRVRGR